MPSLPSISSPITAPAPRTSSHPLPPPPPPSPILSGPLRARWRLSPASIQHARRGFSTTTTATTTAQPRTLPAALRCCCPLQTFPDSLSRPPSPRRCSCSRRLCKPHPSTFLCYPSPRAFLATWYALPRQAALLCLSLPLSSTHPPLWPWRPGALLSCRTQKPLAGRWRPLFLVVPARSGILATAMSFRCAPLTRSVPLFLSTIPFLPINPIRHHRSFPDPAPVNLRPIRFSKVVLVSPSTTPPPPVPPPLPRYYYPSSPRNLSAHLCNLVFPSSALFLPLLVLLMARLC